MGRRNGRREKTSSSCTGRFVSINCGHAPPGGKTRSYPSAREVWPSHAGTHVSVSQPPSFSPRRMGSLIPTAALFDMPRCQRPRVELNGLPSRPAVVASRAKIQRALPPWDTREIMLYFSTVLLGDIDVACEESSDSMRSLRAIKTGEDRPATDISMLGTLAHGNRERTCEVHWK